MINKFLDWVRGRPIIGYGAGELVDRAVAPDSIEIEYFVDNQLSGMFKQGSPVYSIDKLTSETRPVAIVVFSRPASHAIATLFGIGYMWGRDIIDGRHFGFGAPHFDDYELLEDEESIGKSAGVEVYLGPGAKLRARKLVLPRRRDADTVQIHVGDGATLELDNVIIEAGTSISVGRCGFLSIGNLTSIGANCRLSASARARMAIGSRVLISKFSTLDAATGSTIDIGDGATFGEHLEMYAYAPISIGRDCMFSGYVYAESGAGHDLTIDGVKKIPDELRIGDHVWAGMGATLLSGTQVGSNAMIGAKAVVNQLLGENTLTIGNPGRVIKEGILWERDYSAYKRLFHVSE